MVTRQLIRFLLLSVLAASSVGAAPLQCFLDVFSKFQKPGIQFVPRDFKKNFFIDKETWVGSADIVLDDFDSLEGLARVLSMGNPDKKKEILMTLENARLRNEPTIPLASVRFESFKQNGKTWYCDGPNCWNTTLRWFYPKVDIDYTSAAEISEFIESRFLQLSPGERLKFGDVVYLTNSKGAPQHTAVIVDDNLVWHKLGGTEKGPWALETIEGLFRTYAPLADRVEFYRIKSEYR